MEDSRIKDIFKHLQGKGYEVHFPTQKKGECKKPYVVVKDEGSSQYMQLSSNMQLYTIMVYVPLARFGDLEVMVNKIEEDMKEMFPMIVSNNFRTPSFYDDTNKSHMISTQYRNVRKQ